MPMNQIDFENIIKAVKENKTGEGLYLTEKSLDEKQVLMLAEAMRFNTSVKRLGLFGNQIGRIGGIAFAEVLKTNKTLRELGLSSNEIGEEAVVMIAEALKTNDSLRELRLSNTGVKATGAEALSEALKVNFSLRVLRLDRNRIDEAGAIALARALRVNSSLQALWLNSNAIGMLGAIELADGLGQNACLQGLWLNDNGIMEEGGYAFIKALTTNTSLQSLELDNNGIEKSTMDIITQMISDKSRMARKKQFEMKAVEAVQYIKILEEKIRALEKVLSAQKTSSTVAAKNKQAPSRLEKLKENIGFFKNVDSKKEGKLQQPKEQHKMQVARHLYTSYRRLSL